MKKYSLCIAIMIICVLLCYTVSADTINNNIIEFFDADVTVVFDEQTSYDIVKMNDIANKLISDSETSNVQPRAFCWLTGHDLTSELVNVIHHKVNAIHPRCLRDSYKVTTCSKCDYYEEELIGSAYINCCPLD